MKATTTRLARATIPFIGEEGEETPTTFHLNLNVEPELMDENAVAKSTSPPILQRGLRRLEYGISRPGSVTSVHISRLATRRPNRSAGVPRLLLSAAVSGTRRAIRSRRSHCGRRQGGRALETAWNSQGHLSWDCSHRPTDRAEGHRHLPRRRRQADGALGRIRPLWRARGKPTTFATVA
jgi:hypothetical protein